MVESIERENILFAALAVQAGLVDWDAVKQVLEKLAPESSRPLSEVLVEEGKLAPEQHQRLAALVAEHVRQHNCDLARMAYFQLHK